MVLEWVAVRGLVDTQAVASVAAVAQEVAVEVVEAVLVYQELVIVALE